VSDTPEDLARRDNAAIAQVACLLPANADEADLAAQYVAANAYAMDCLRLANECRTTDHRKMLQCGAQATSSMRQARGYRSLLLRRLGQLPDNPSFGPPEADLVQALVTGRTPGLLALDRPAAEAGTA